MLSNEQEITVKKFQEGKNIFISGPEVVVKDFIIKHLCSLNSVKILVYVIRLCSNFVGKSKDMHSFLIN